MTRMRFCDRNGQDGSAGQGHRAAATGYLRWYETRPKEAAHAASSATGRSSGWCREPGIVGLDSGCVWGGALSALRLEDRTLFQVPCPGYQAPGGEG